MPVTTIAGLITVGVLRKLSWGGQPEAQALERASHGASHESGEEPLISTPLPGPGGGEGAPRVPAGGPLGRWMRGPQPGDQGSDVGGEKSRAPAPRERRGEPARKRSNAPRLRGLRSF